MVSRNEAIWFLRPRIDAALLPFPFPFDAPPV